MPLDLAAGDYVKQLHRAGLRPGERLVQNILNAGEIAVGPLIDLATDSSWLDKPAPERYAPLHALRLLGETHSPRMIEPLLAQFPIDIMEETDALDLWLQELPQILGRLGGDAVDPLWQFADNEARHIAGRGTAILALAYTTAIDESLRDAVIAGLRERLERSDNRDSNAYLIRALAYLGVASMYRDVMAFYRNGAVNQEITTAALARQLMLTSGRNLLACAKHPLWERYDEHGPREDNSLEDEE